VIGTALPATSTQRQALETAQAELDAYAGPEPSIEVPETVLAGLRALDNAEAPVELRRYALRLIDRVEVARGQGNVAIEEKVKVFWKDGQVTPSEVGLKAVLAAGREEL
jgi:hypothetical protein